MAEETTITPDGSSPDATVEPTPQPDPVVFIDDPDPVDEPGVNAETDPDPDEGRFDKNPKFQERLTSMKEKEQKADELISEYKALLAQTQKPDTSRYESQIADLNKKIEALTKPATEKPDFWDSTTLDRDAFMERWDTDLVGVYGNIGRQLRHELRSHLPQEDKLVDAITEKVFGKITETSNKMSAQTTVKSFADKNKDFKDMLPEIQKYMKENLGHNEFSAYHELKAQDREAEIEKLVEERMKKRDAEALKDGAKTVTKPISSGTKPSPPKTGGPVPDDVINPEKHGTTSGAAILNMIKRGRKGGKKE